MYSSTSALIAIAIATTLSEDTVERLHNRVEREVRAALKPFGYYEPVVGSKLEKRGDKDWLVSIDIQPGEPVVMKRRDNRRAWPRFRRPAVCPDRCESPAAHW